MNKSFIKATALTLFAAFCVTATAPIATLSTTAAETATKATTTKSTGTKSTTAHVDYLKDVEKKINYYKKNGKNIIGYLTIPGTNIDEPVAYSSKSNLDLVYADWKGNQYPQIHTYPNYKNYPSTVTYLDYRVNPALVAKPDSWNAKGAARNYVLYGHNWNNLAVGGNAQIGNVKGLNMFAQLPSFTSGQFAAQHPYIYFSIGANRGTWKVFSVCYVENKSTFPYNNPYTNNLEGFKKNLAELKARSMFNYSTDVKATDKTLTLSTCTRRYNVGDLQRFIVVARLLRDGETDKDKVTVSANSKMKAPKFN